MIYYEVHENGAVLRAFRKALANEPKLNCIDFEDQVGRIYKLAEINNMIIHGMSDGTYWETTGFTFSNEQSLAMFLLKWS